MKSAWLLVLAACRSPSSSQQHPLDGPIADAAIDSPEQCAMARIIPEDERKPIEHARVPSPPPGHDGGIILVDAGFPPDAGGCDPLSQYGCAPGQKCTWLKDHDGCAPAGTAA